MWAKYGPSRGESNCEADLGYGLLEAWRSKNASYCSPHSNGTIDSRSPSVRRVNACMMMNSFIYSFTCMTWIGDSELTCFLIRQNHHAGGGDNLCLGTNMRMNFGELADPEVTRKTMDR